jgi:hypothetical protein
MTVVRSKIKAENEREYESKNECKECVRLPKRLGEHEGNGFFLSPSTTIAAAVTGDTGETRLKLPTCPDKALLSISQVQWNTESSKE